VLRLAFAWIGRAGAASASIPSWSGARRSMPTFRNALRPGGNRRTIANRRCGGFFVTDRHARHAPHATRMHAPRVYFARPRFAVGEAASRPLPKAQRP
jgi:hypothetical protein